MRCLYCQKRLWNPFAKSQFCTPLHESWFREEQSGEAIRRLLEPAHAVAAPSAPVVAADLEGTADVGTRQDTAAQLAELQTALRQPDAAIALPLPANLPVPVSLRYINQTSRAIIGDGSGQTSAELEVHESAASITTSQSRASVATIDSGSDDPPLARYCVEFPESVPPPSVPGGSGHDEFVPPGYVVVPDSWLEPSP